MRNPSCKLIVVFALLFILNGVNTDYAKDEKLPKKGNTLKNTKSDNKKYGIDRAITSKSIPQISNPPVTFEENKGQTNKSVKFLARGKDFNLSLSANETVYNVLEANCERSGKENRKRKLKPCRTLSLKMKMAGANEDSIIQGIEETVTKSNYYIGNDPTKWLDDISNYKTVRYRKIYQGIDVIFQGSEQNLEYDFHVLPGADPKMIQLEFEGTEKTKIDRNGNLVFKFKGVELRHQKPVAYQIIDGEKREVFAEFVLLRRNQVGFKVGDYDTSQELIIDPIIYSTYLGGSGADDTNDVAVDSSGNIYLATRASSVDFLNPNLPRMGSHDLDAVVTKLSPDGTQIIYNTLLSGSLYDKYDEPYAIDVDASGNAYVAGYTESKDFPMLNARQTASNTTTGGAEGFITKLSPSGTLLYSTYHGSLNDSYDYVDDIAVDAAGNAYVVGDTSGNNFPVLNAFQPAFGDSRDAYLSKLSPGGDLLYSTYLGGIDTDSALDVAVDNQGNAYVTGQTGIDFPVTANAYRTSGIGFATKFNTNLSGSQSLIYSTYLTDTGKAIAIDKSGNAYIVGSGVSGYVKSSGVKLNSTGSGIHWSFPTINGYVNDVVVDSDGNAYYAEGLEVFSNSYNNGIKIRKISASSGTVVVSETLNGTYRDVPTGIAFGGGYVYVAGYTSSLDFPTTSDAIL